MFYIGALCMFFIAMGLMYGEARYLHGRADVIEEIMKLYEKEERNN